MLVSPIVLVRLLDVQQFGIYREFLLYASVLSSIAAFNISNSLMYFVPAQPQHTWRYVRQATILVAIASTVLVGAAVLADGASGGRLLGMHRWSVAAYTLCFVNVDFWEHVWLAQRRPRRVLVYTLARLGGRLAVVTAAAAITPSAPALIWSLVVFEAVRLAVSFIAWRAVAQPLEPAPEDSWRAQLRSCLPLGTSLILMTLIRNVGGLFVARLLGPGALAQYTLGTYAAPIIVVLRNSVSDALLPEMAQRQQADAGGLLVLWRRSVVLFALLLFPAAVLLARFAEVIVHTLFSKQYADAIPVFQAYALLLVRECVDFGVLVRALNQNRLLVSANLLALGVSIVLLPLLVDHLGLVGAVVALLAARFMEGAWQLWSVASFCGISPRKLLPWGQLGQVAATALVSGAVLLGWRDDTLLRSMLGAMGYLGIYFGLLWLGRVPEFRLLAQRLPAWTR